MENSIDQIVNDIAISINNIIPVKWKDAYFYGEVGENKESHIIGMYFYNKKKRSYMDFTEITDFYPSANNFSTEFNKLNNLVLELYDVFIKNDMQPWGAVLIEIDKKRKVNMKFSYDWFENGEDEFQRKILWAHTTFGFTPQKGGYAEKIINKYDNK